MTTTIVFFLIGALIGLAVVLLVSEWVTTESARLRSLIEMSDRDV